MATMIELYYERPEDPAKEMHAIGLAEQYGGRLTCKETDLPNTLCLTIEFETWDQAVEVADELRAAGVHIEGPCFYH